MRLLPLLLLLLVTTARAAEPRLVLAGGGSEGELGETASWSYSLYREFLARGDVNGDGQVVVCILCDRPQTSFIPRYFRWLGADGAFNLCVPSREEANDRRVAARLLEADAVFIKGGDQGRYHDAWSGTRLAAAIRKLALLRGGTVGGTSAGAMAMGEFVLAGSKDLISQDVLRDSHTPNLLDDDGGSGVHPGFLGLARGLTIDTHFSERDRLWRMLGVLAVIVDSHGRRDVLAAGIDERTGLVLEGARWRVIGIGSVTFARVTKMTQLRREPGRPLVFTHLDLRRVRPPAARNARRNQGTRSPRSRG